MRSGDSRVMRESVPLRAEVRWEAGGGAKVAVAEGAAEKKLRPAKSVGSGAMPRI